MSPAVWTLAASIDAPHVIRRASPRVASAIRSHRAAFLGGHRRDRTRAPTTTRAGAKGGGGKKSNDGANPFASSELMKLRSTLPSKPELAADRGGAGSGNDMVRMSEADVVAAFSSKKKGGSMKAERGAARKPPAGAAKKPGSIGSGTGASRGLDPGMQSVTVGVTKSGTKGKTVTVVDGLDVGAAEDAKALLKKFKKILGSGGALAENGSMAFQGDNAALLVDMLRATTATSGPRYYLPMPTVSLKKTEFSIVKPEKPFCRISWKWVEANRQWSYLSRLEAESLKWMHYCVTVG